MWQYTTKDGKLTAYEGATAFYIVNNETEEERCWGDGVDAAGEGVSVSTPEFYRAIEADLEQFEWQWCEAYFGE